MNTLTLRHQLPQAILVESMRGSATFDPGEAQPRLSFADAVFDRIEAIDVLEHVMDEEVWLAECARVLVPGGTLELQVPYAGWTGWLDHLNIYRYMTDVLGIGEDPRETKPNGWHHQYKTADVLAMLEKAGFQAGQIRRHSLGVAELPALAHLIVGDAVRKDPETAAQVKRRRTPIERRDAAILAGPLSRRLRVVATKR